MNGLTSFGFAIMLVAFGSALGGVLRFLVGVIALKWNGAPHWTTAVINIAGSFVIGISAAHLDGTNDPSKQTWLREFLMIGILGGFTTFSSFSLQTFQLFSSGKMGSALLNILISFTGCLFAVAIGFWLGKKF